MKAKQSPTKRGLLRAIATTLAVLVLTFLFPAPVRAQGKVEVAGYGGGSVFSDEGGTHAIVGGAAGYDATPHVHVFGEFGYIPLSSERLSGTAAGQSFSASGNARWMQFGGGIHVHFRPVGPESKAVPYMVIPVGVGRASVSASVRGQGVNISESESSSHFYTGAGAGLRYFAGRNWGIRPEFRWVQAFGEESGHMLVFQVGVFYQFGR
jgi:opacity protein-like surface antigen